MSDARTTTDPRATDPRAAEARAKHPRTEPTQPRPLPAGTELPGERELPAQRRDELRRDWLQIQGSFIDEPGESVRKADFLVKQLLASVSERFEAARRDLEHERGEESRDVHGVAAARAAALPDALRAALVFLIGTPAGAQSAPRLSCSTAYWHARAVSAM
jgi:hypothetical protein